MHTIRFIARTQNRITQRAYATITQVRYDKQSITDKYAEKLQQRARQEGVETIDELKQKLSSSLKASKAAETAKRIADVKRKIKTARASSKLVEKTVSPPPPPAPRKYAFKTLHEIMNLEKTTPLASDELANLWATYNAEKGNLSASIPAETYHRLYAQSKKYPVFILPLIHNDDAVEFYYLQWTHHNAESAPHPLTTHVLFTPLGEYKLRGEFAVPKLTITHHADVVDKGVVLMQGEITVTESGSRSLNEQQAQWLLFQLQQFYITGGENKIAMLEAFHRNPEQFDYQEFINEAKRVV